MIDQIPNAASVSMPPKKSLAWLWILLAVIAVAAVAAGAYFYLNRTATVPTVVQMAQEDAQTSITAAGFKVGSVTTTQTVEKSEVGKVVAQTPAGGGQAKVGSAIDIVVSGGQLLINVPDVGGMKQADAEAAITAAGLKPFVADGNSADVPVGNVMAQGPVAGSDVAPGTEVRLTISQGPQFSTVPDVVGQSQSDAQATLKAAGLAMKAVSNYSSAPNGDVYSQTPAEGVKVAPGTTVSVTVSKGPAPSPTTVTCPQCDREDPVQCNDHAGERGLRRDGQPDRERHRRSGGRAGAGGQHQGAEGLDGLDPGLDRRHPLGAGSRTASRPTKRHDKQGVSAISAGAPCSVRGLSRSTSGMTYLALFTLLQGGSR